MPRKLLAPFADVWRGECDLQGRSDCIGTITDTGNQQTQFMQRCSGEVCDIATPES
jgi:hypothetical protein